MIHQVEQVIDHVYLRQIIGTIEMLVDVGHRVDAVLTFQEGLPRLFVLDRHRLKFEQPGDDG